jgi:hypothetical protein
MSATELRSAVDSGASDSVRRGVQLGQRTPARVDRRPFLATKMTSPPQPEQIAPTSAPVIASPPRSDEAHKIAQGRRGTDRQVGLRGVPDREPEAYQRPLSRRTTRPIRPGPILVPFCHLADPLVGL